jgi:hypothetical protein
MFIYISQLSNFQKQCLHFVLKLLESENYAKKFSRFFLSLVDLFINSHLYFSFSSLFIFLGIKLTYLAICHCGRDSGLIGATHTRWDSHP